MTEIVISSIREKLQSCNPNNTPDYYVSKACRGLQKEEAAWDLDVVDSHVQTDAKSEMVEEEGVCVVTPAGSDFIVCYAAANGQFNGPDSC